MVKNSDWDASEGKKFRQGGRRKTGRPSKRAKSSGLVGVCSNLTLEDLCASVALPNTTWSSNSTEETFTAFTVRQKDSTTPGETIPVVTRSVTVRSDLSWSVVVHGKCVTHCCCALKSFPNTIESSDTVQKLLCTLDSLHVCAGHPDEEYVSLVEARKGKVQCGSSQSALIDEYFPVELNGRVYSKTVRSTGCEMLVHEMKCDACKAYRPNLRSLCSRQKKHKNVTPTRRTKSCSRVNFCYLSTPEKAARLCSCSSNAKAAKEEVRRLKQWMKTVTQEHGVSVDDEISSHLLEVVCSQNDEVCKAYPPGSFARLFWEQQVARSPQIQR